MVCRNAKALPQYVKSFVRKGGALLGLLRHREAVMIRLPLLSMPALTAHSVRDATGLADGALHLADNTSV